MSEVLLSEEENNVSQNRKCEIFPKRWNHNIWSAAIIARCYNHKEEIIATVLKPRRNPRTDRATSCLSGKHQSSRWQMELQKNKNSMFSPFSAVGLPRNMSLNPQEQVGSLLTLKKILLYRSTHPHYGLPFNVTEQKSLQTRLEYLNCIICQCPDQEQDTRGNHQQMKDFIW